MFIFSNYYYIGTNLVYFLIQYIWKQKYIRIFFSKLHIYILTRERIGKFKNILIQSIILVLLFPIVPMNNSNEYFFSIRDIYNIYLFVYKYKQAALLKTNM